MLAAALTWSDAALERAFLDWKARDTASFASSSSAWSFVSPTTSAQTASRSSRASSQAFHALASFVAAAV